jgi:hypothetical protein
MFNNSCKIKKFIVEVSELNLLFNESPYSFLGTKLRRLVGLKISRTVVFI